MHQKNENTAAGRDFLQHQLNALCYWIQIHIHIIMPLL